MQGSRPNLLPYLHINYFSVYWPYFLTQQKTRNNLGWLTWTSIKTENIATTKNPNICWSHFKLMYYFFVTTLYYLNRFKEILTVWQACIYSWMNILCFASTYQSICHSPSCLSQLSIRYFSFCFVETFEMLRGWIIEMQYHYLWCSELLSVIIKHLEIIWDCSDE